MSYTLNPVTHKVDYILAHPDLLSATAFKAGVKLTPTGVRRPLSVGSTAGCKRCMISDIDLAVPVNCIAATLSKSEGYSTRNLLNFTRQQVTSEIPQMPCPDSVTIVTLVTGVWYTTPGDQ